MDYRVDKIAASKISEYIAWGSIDHSFFSKNIKELQNKISIIGNCRSDLVTEIGKKFYSKTVEAIQEIYGKFYLCSDNFSVERRRKDYVHPSFNVSREANEKVQYQYQVTTSRNKLRRVRYADVLEKAIIENPDINFVIRPHPVSDPRWWNNRFWEYHNVHITNIKNLEPWLQASQGIISMGCTSALQAQKAEIDSINISSGDGNEKYSFNFPEEILGLKISSGDELANCVKWKKQNKINYQLLATTTKLFLAKYGTSNDDPISLNYAQKVNQYMPISKKITLMILHLKFKIEKCLRIKIPYRSRQMGNPSLQE